MLSFPCSEDITEVYPLSRINLEVKLKSATDKQETVS